MKELIGPALAVEITLQNVEKKKEKTTYCFLLNGLAAPLGSGSEEPGDGQYNPPHDASDGEEVEEHEEQRATFTLRAHHNRVHGRRVRGGDTRRLVPQQEANEVHEGDQAVADSVEDDGPLRIAEALDVDEKGEEGEERGSQADDGANADEGLSKVDVVRLEEHVGTGWGAVLCVQEGRTQTWFGL